MRLMKMKKLFALLALFLVLSCDVSDDESNFHFEFLPVESVEVPEFFTLNEVHEITATIARPNDCYLFYGFSVEQGPEELDRTVAVVTTVFDDQVCAEVTNTQEVSFNFIALYEGTYTFNFWQGEDENGDDVFLTVEVPVNN